MREFRLPNLSSFRFFRVSGGGMLRPARDGAEVLTGLTGFAGLTGLFLVAMPCQARNCPGASRGGAEEAEAQRVFETILPTARQRQSNRFASSASLRLCVNKVPSMRRDGEPQTLALGRWSLHGAKTGKAPPGSGRTPRFSKPAPGYAESPHAESSAKGDCLSADVLSSDGDMFWIYPRAENVLTRKGADGRVEPAPAGTARTNPSQRNTP